MLNGSHEEGAQSSALSGHQVWFLAAVEDGYGFTLPSCNESVLHQSVHDEREHPDEKGQGLKALKIRKATVMLTKASNRRMGRKTSLLAMVVRAPTHASSSHSASVTTGKTVRAGITSSADQRRFFRSHSLTFPSGEIHRSMQRMV